MNKTQLIIGLVIAALLIVSVVQIVAINSAKAVLKQSGYSGNIPVSSGASYPSGGGAAAPAMVGGC